MAHFPQDVFGRPYAYVQISEEVSEESCQIIEEKTRITNDEYLAVKCDPNKTPMPNGWRITKLQDGLDMNKLPAIVYGECEPTTKPNN